MVEKESLPPPTATTQSAVPKEKANTPKSGYFKLPGMQLEARAWASIRMQIIHDLINGVENGAGYDCMHITSIPLKKNDKNVTRAHRRETRFGIEVLAPAQWGGGAAPARLFLESDLFGAQDMVGGENTTNQALLRIRHAYVEWGPLIIGQYWGVFCDHCAFVDVVDFSPPVGGVSLRSPQIRYTCHVKEDIDLVATIENPEGEYLDQNGKANFTKAQGRYRFNPTDNDNCAVDKFPDIGFCATLNQRDGGHMAFRSAVRYLHTKKAEKKSFVIGAVVGVGGLFKVFGRDEINVQVNGGRGAGRYLYELSGTAAYLDKDNVLHVQPSVGGFLSYKHFWNSSIWSVLAGGYAFVKNHEDLRNTKTSTAVNKDVISVNANTHWRPEGFKNAKFGIEYLWGMRRTEKGGTGNLNRVMIGAKIDF
jgi:hypothetical protein